MIRMHGHSGRIIPISSIQTHLFFFDLCLFCLFGVYRPTRKLFTHMETSPLPVKGCKFWPILGTHGQWAMSVFKRATPTVTRGIRLLWFSPRTRDTHTNCRAFGSGAVTTCFYDLRRGWDSNTQPSACKATALTNCAITAVDLYLKY